MDNTSLSPFASSAPRPTPLRVFRVPPGKAAKIVLLSKNVAGVFVHWVKTRSWLCVGMECPANLHKGDRLWKGYVSALLWDQAACHWLPIVAELSEHVELDMRGQMARGQMWEIMRGATVGKRHQPTKAMLIGTQKSSDLPMDYDTMPTLQHLYHAEKIDISFTNPLPARVMVLPFSAPPPPKRMEESGDDKPISSEELTRGLNQMRQRLGVMPPAK